jgi:hypothetical protein
MMILKFEFYKALSMLQISSPEEIADPLVCHLLLKLAWLFLQKIKI